MKIIDYSFARPGGEAIKKAGYVGVMRYLSYTTGKTIDAKELKDLQDNGLSVGLVWETTAKRPLDGESAGKLDATEAQKEAEKLGFKNPTIYFAVDFDSTPTQQTQIDAYLKGCAEIIGEKSVGVYGSYYIVERCFKNGTATWFWQTLAWSGGQKSVYNHLYQNGKSDFNNGVDVNDVLQNNWGQCIPGGDIPVPKIDPPVEITQEPVSIPETTSEPVTVANQASTNESLSQVGQIIAENATPTLWERILGFFESLINFFK